MNRVKISALVDLGGTDPSNGAVFPQTSSTFAARHSGRIPVGSVDRQPLPSCFPTANRSWKRRHGNRDGKENTDSSPFPPGTYTLTVAAKGFSRHQQTESATPWSTPQATANIRLKVGSASESVTVTMRSSRS